MMHDHLTTSAILRIFTDEVRLGGGSVKDTFYDSRRLIARSLMPKPKQVRPKDRMQAGLAIRATDEELWLHPYLYRQVCRNGAIMAQALESLHVECLGLYTLEEGTEMLREAIARCSAKEVFARSIRRVRSAATTEVDELLNLLPHLEHLQGTGTERFLDEILNRFTTGRDRTRFGLMNAVTSVARDTRDPEARWRLEELGGGIGARLRPRRPSPAPAHTRSQRHPVASL